MQSVLFSFRFVLPKGRGRRAQVFLLIVFFCLFLLLAWLASAGHWPRLPVRQVNPGCVVFVFLGSATPPLSPENPYIDKFF